MRTYRDLLCEVRERQGELIAACAVGRRLDLKWERDRNEPKFVSSYRDNPSYTCELRELPKIKAIVAGIDVREWTRRTWPAQTVIASILNASVQESLRLLKAGGVLSDEEPLFIVPSGDGAFLVFDDRRRLAPKAATGTASTAESFPREVIAQALMFTLTMNTLLLKQNQLNRLTESGDNHEDGGRGFPILPIYPRFCLTLDELLLCVDVNGRLNAVGRGMVTCARIMATDHGNHFLVHDKLLHECNAYGGMDRILRASRGGDWETRFHITELADKRVKSGSFRYADVFGHYSDGPLLRLLRSPSVRPEVHHVGSHDVQQLD